MSIPLYPGAPLATYKLENKSPANTVITTIIEESVEPLKEKNSLVFTISANGKTWPKLLDYKSSKNDIELRIYSPVPAGCLIQFKRAEDCLSEFQPLPEVLGELTVEQQKKINAILAQKARINYLLGTLMVSYPLQLDERYGKREPDFMKVKVGPENFGHRDSVGGNNYQLKVIDCSYGTLCKFTCQGYFANIKYNDVNFSFVVPCINITSFLPQGSKDIRTRVKEIQKESFQEKLSCSFPYTLVKAFPAKNKSFDISGNTIYPEDRNGMKRMSNELVVMYGKNNIFDAFSIDDALLILEENRLSETVSDVGWTLCIAQNKVARNLPRLQSNNPSLS